MLFKIGLFQFVAFTDALKLMIRVNLSEAFD